MRAKKYSKLKSTPSFIIKMTVSFLEDSLIKTKINVQLNYTKLTLKNDAEFRFGLCFVFLAAFNLPRSSFAWHKVIVIIAVTA